MTKAVTTSQRVNAALQLPNGARFYRCALQINPVAYLSRHHKATGFKSEAEYNAAIVAACIANGIEVIAVTGWRAFHLPVRLVASIDAMAEWHLPPRKREWTGRSHPDEW